MIHLLKVVKKESSTSREIPLLLLVWSFTTVLRLSPFEICFKSLIEEIIANGPCNNHMSPGPVGLFASSYPSHMVELSEQVGGSDLHRSTSKAVSIISGVKTRSHLSYLQLTLKGLGVTSIILRPISLVAFVFQWG
jgi:hypothetical protein